MGTSPGKDDVASFKALSHSVKHFCQPGNLKHNKTYFATVIAWNGGLNEKSVNISTNGGNEFHIKFHVSRKCHYYSIANESTMRSFSDEFLKG